MSTDLIKPPIDHSLALAIAGLIQAAAAMPERATGKFTPDVIQRIVAALRLGHTVNDACVFAGISPTTYQNWQRKGQNGEAPFDLFCEVLERLNVASYTDAVACFSKGATEDPKVAERFLARRAKDQWGTKEDSAGSGGITVLFGLELRGGAEVDRG